MKRYITIDGGTTNTRVCLAEDRRIKGTVKIPLGAQKSIGNADALRAAVKHAIDTLLTEHGLQASDITRILASGMITSEFGLYKLDHLIAPAGLRELHEGMREVRLSDLSEISFVFLPGVRTDGDRLEERDMMRGEETELMGLMELTKKDTAASGTCVYVLPGSHSKLIRTDQSGRIVSFSTMLTGEMIAALSGNTILKDAVDLSCTESDANYLLKGCDYTLTHGINEALFKTRILKNLFGATSTETYSFFMGAVLAAEIQAILDCDADTVIIGGKPQIRDAMATILSARSNKTICAVSDEAVARSTTEGMIRVFEYGTAEK